MIQDSPMKMKWTAVVKSLLIVVFFTFVTILLFAYFPPPLLDRVMPGDKTVAILQKQNKQLKVSNDELKNELNRYRKQADFYKKKAERPITVSDKSLQGISIPSIQPKFISWEEFRTQQPNVLFSAYRQQQVDFLSAELQKSCEFMETLKNR